MRKKIKFQEKWGDLLKEASNYHAVIHGCNCHNTMGGGIAFGVAKMYPKAARVDKKTKHGDINKLGNIKVVKINKKVRIVNAYTQFVPGADVYYSAIHLCLKKINDRFKGKKVALPMIGAGIAGGDFLIIRKMIIDELKDCYVTIIYWPGDKEKVEKMGINPL